MAVVTLVAAATIPLVSLPHVSVLYLSAVVASAALWGLGPSLLAAVLSVACSSFLFYSPIYSFRVAAPQDIADLVAFVIVAVFTSRLASDVRAQALEARRRQERIGRLYAFSERLAASQGSRELHAAILEHLAPVLGRPIHLLQPGKDGAMSVAASLGDAGPAPEALIAAAGIVLAGGRPPPGPWRIEPLSTAQGAVAVVAARADAAPAQAEADFARSLLGHAAIAVERARLASEIEDARVRAQGEALREALINSVSHDLRTPLASILGSATALETLEAAGDAGSRKELVATIREEADRLSSYIGNVLDLTRIRSGQIAPRLELVELSDIIDSALQRKREALAGHELRVALAPDLPMLRLDLFLMEHALANVLDNAAKYSPRGSRVDLTASVREGELLLEITDRGSGIPPQERERVFEPFHRLAGPGKPATGSGLGLAICRAFVHANGGTVSALGAACGGTTIRMRLPQAGDRG